MQNGTTKATTRTSNSVNDLNQVTTGTSGGPLMLSGTLQEPATVTVGGNSATVNSLSFSGTAAVTTGTNNLITVIATDASNQSVTHEYRVTVPAVSGSYSYDSDGNLTSDGTNSYQWDAADRLTGITEPGNLSTTITYDGLGRRAQIVEKNNGTVTTTRNLLWCETELCEERNAGDAVTKRYYPQGVQLSGSSCYYTFDHLGSIREVTGTSQVVEARYDYDPYGQQTQLSGTLSADFGYAGYYEHRPSGLDFALLRGYHPNLGRWMSRDPLGEAGGINLYGYVRNDPISLIDPLGLCSVPMKGGFHPTNGPWNNYDTAALLGLGLTPIAGIEIGGLLFGAGADAAATGIGDSLPDLGAGSWSQIGEGTYEWVPDMDPVGPDEAPPDPGRGPLGPPPPEGAGPGRGPLGPDGADPNPPPGQGPYWRN